MVGASGVGSPASPCIRTQPKLSSFSVRLETIDV